MAGNNVFTSMPFIPYKIATAILDNDNLCNLLFYNTYDCLSLKNLTDNQKEEMIWKQDVDTIDDCHIFLTNTNSKIVTESKTLLQCYKFDTSPTNQVISVVCYRFDVLFGSDIAMVEYRGVPCNRGDVIEMELMKSLNGQDVAGAGFLTYDRNLSRLCGSNTGIGENDKFTGTSIIMCTQIGDIKNGKC